MNQRAVVLSYPGSIFYEVSTAVALLGEAIAVDFAGPSHDPIRESYGFSYNVNLSYEELDPTQYTVALIPGGDFESILQNSAIDRFLQHFVSQKESLLGAICNGACVAAKAGVLRGRKCTHTAHPKYAPREEFSELLDLAEKIFAQSTYVDEELVLDGNFLTAKPSAQVDFGLQIAHLAGLISKEAFPMRYNYQHGFPAQSSIGAEANVFGRSSGFTLPL